MTVRPTLTAMAAVSILGQASLSASAPDGPGEPYVLQSPVAPGDTLPVWQWEADIDSLVAGVLGLHAMPFFRTLESDFRARAAVLKQRLPDLDHHGRTVGLMELLASLDQGHSNVYPTGEHGFKLWYPLRLTRFPDGVFITAIHSQLARFAGSRVTTIAGRPAEEVAVRASRLLGSDNAFFERTNAYYLSSAEALAGLGVLARPGPVELGVVRRDGDSATVRIEPISADEPARMGWRSWGEMFAPTNTPGVSAFDRPTEAHLGGADDALPLHVRSRRGYWFTLLQDSATAYLQFNSVTNSSSYTDESFVQMYERMFRVLDGLGDRVERFILDIRYNAGGNGDLVNDFVHEFIKREDTLNRPGRLFVLTGPRTWSAAITLASSMLEHTNALLVGEPMAGGFLHTGNPVTVRLPHTGFSASYSTTWEQHASWNDARRVVGVQIPVVMLGADYVAGRDPVLQLVLDAPVPYPTILATLRAGDANAARALFQTRRSEFGGIDWWEPFTESAMNDLGYDFLESDPDLAVAAFTANTVVYPRSWNVWDSLGDGLMAQGRDAEAAAAFLRALSVDPTNWNSSVQLARVRELSAAR